MMKQLKTLLSVCGAIVLVLTSALCQAEVKVPCLVFSGNSETSHAIDLSKFNRITFGENSMIISSSAEGVDSSEELLYSLFHHIEIDERVPDVINTKLQDINSDAGNTLYYESTIKRLRLESAFDSRFYVGVFTVDGKLLLTAEMTGTDELNLEMLSAGAYVAVATDNKIVLNHKFIVN